MRFFGIVDPTLNPLAWFDEQCVVTLGLYDEDLVANPYIGSIASTGAVSGSLTGAALDASGMTAAGSVSGSFTGGALDASAIAATGAVTGSLTGAALDASAIAATGAVSGSITGAALDASAIAATGAVAGSPTGAALDAAAIASSSSVAGSFTDGTTDRADPSGAGTVTGSFTGTSVIAPSDMAGTGGAAGSFTGTSTGGLVVVGVPSTTGSGGGFDRVIDEAYVQRLLADARRAAEAKRPPRTLEAPKIEPRFASAGMRAAGAVVGAVAAMALASAGATGEARADGEVTTRSLVAAAMPGWASSAGGFGTDRQLSGAAIAGEIDRARAVDVTRIEHLGLRVAMLERAFASFVPTVVVRADRAGARAPASDPRAAQREAIQRTVAQVRSSRALGHTHPRTRIPRAVYPKLIEVEYGKAMIDLVGAARRAIAPLQREMPHLLAARTDSARRDVGETARARDLINLARHHFEGAIRTSDVEALARRFADRTQGQQREQLGRQIRAALGVDVVANDRKLAGLIDGFVHENAVLIKSVPGDVIDGIEKLTTRAFADGARHEDLADAIEERFEIGERRARTIARDQVGKLYGRVNRARQTELGIGSFEWASMKDERVRPDHEELDGQVFSWDDPPDEGIPGEPVLCRCAAIPVFDAILAALEDDEE